MYNHQRIYVNQVIYNFWIRIQEGILDKIRRRGKPVRITGDGQYDSPGHNARYCFYTMIESVSKLVVDFYMAEKTMVSGNSQNHRINNTEKIRIRIQLLLRILLTIFPSRLRIRQKVSNPTGG
jgi:hypothetical protein